MIKPKELFFRARTPALSEFKLDEPTNHTIICCPNPPQAAVQAGRAIAVPQGEFSVDRVIKQLPLGYQPDIVHISARDIKFKPIGLNKFNCPTVMKIGDTFHWGDGSLSGIVRYCQILQCDYHWVYQGVQHLHFFVEAGLKNVFWLPGTPVIEPYIPEKSPAKTYDVVFRGSRSELHAYRSQLVRFLDQTNISIDFARKPYIDSLNDYTKGRIVFNCSLNGDTNRRIFEVLMVGGFLLTDRLSPQSGLFQLFQEGVHLECYGSEQELLDKINYYLQHPDKAEQIAASGQQQLLQHFNQQDTQQRFYHYILNDELESPFRLEHDQRALRCHLGNDDALNARLKIYQVIQEAHRLNSRISLIYWGGQCKELVSDLADMPRLEITYMNDTLGEMKDWCTQVGVSNQVKFQDMSQASNTIQRFQIVLVDAPNSIAEMTALTEQVLPLMANRGLLLLVGQPQPSLRQLLKSALKLKGLQPTDLRFQIQEPKTKAYLAYLKGGDRTPSSHADSELILNPLSLRTKLANRIKRLPLIKDYKKVQAIQK
ncbi:MAG: glycosyltransferase family 1 protein [Oscillatoriophycideae cyanobacterium NC_groundwater_1537_Pr4_S-0.65um_50_18]|nr:glycosyltransferase family 1 protein [Oscillatoriophycideae cyanobacterium NC_groundwater_1537_Pr4_S-0.65um_50_18]